MNKETWLSLTEVERHELLCKALSDLFELRKLSASKVKHDTFTKHRLEKLIVNTIKWEHELEQKKDCPSISLEAAWR